MKPPEIIPFEPAHIQPAAVLLAERHRAHRRAEPLLSPRFEEPAAARAEIEALLARDGVTGSVALRNGRVTGYLLGTLRDDATWGPNVWVEAAGHAVEEPESARDLYAHAAERWVEAGRTAHYAMVPATDPPLVDAWFRLGFGQQHVHALREPELSEPGLPEGSMIRRAALTDLDALAELELLLSAHQARSPVFSTYPALTVEEARADWEEGLQDPAYTAFVAEVDGEVAAAAGGCAVELSRAHSGIARPEEAALLAFAAVRSGMRGRGLGTALGRTVLAWAGRSGYRSVVTDWRATNLLSSRCWPRLGFRPAFLRLFRAV